MLTSIKPYAAVAVLLLGVGSAYAKGYVDTEINNPISKSQPVDNGADKEIVIQGMIGNSPVDGDLDFFKFHGKTGEVVDITLTSVPASYPVVAVFALRLDPKEKVVKYYMLRQGYSTSSSNINAYITQLKLEDEDYWVAVSNRFRTFKTWDPSASPYGAKTAEYSLSITGLTPAVKPVSIDIKPGSDELAPVNPKSRGRIPVAILTTADFDALQVDPESLSFGKTGTELNPAKCDMSGVDVDLDGDLDVVCHFWNDLANFEEGDTEGKLIGKTKDGLVIEGVGYLKVVPAAKGQSNK